MDMDAIPAAGMDRLELLQVADTVAREKSIERDEVLEAMEQAIQKAARSKYGQEHDVRAYIDRKSGDIKLARILEVAEEVENEITQLTLEQARHRKPDAEIGDFLVDPLPPIDFSRIAAQTAKQVIVQRVRDAERQQQYEEYKDRAGEVVNGIVKRVEFGNLTVDLGRAEAVLRRDEMIPRESFRAGDRVRAYIYDVRSEPRGPQIFLTRTRPEFMAKLFAQEVPEVYDKIIEIRAVARDPGSRAKIAVLSNDSSIDPVGACVGMRGSRVQAVVGELQGEKIDIIQWNPDPATFIVNALAPAEVAKVVLDEDQRRIEVVVPDDQLSLAIGRRGQNVRLASHLTQWEIAILTEDEESERRQEEFPHPVADVHGRARCRRRARPSDRRRGVLDRRGGGVRADDRPSFHRGLRPGAGGRAARPRHRVSCRGGGAVDRPPARVGGFRRARRDPRPVAGDGGNPGRGRHQVARRFRRSVDRRGNRPGGGSLARLRAHRGRGRTG